MIDINLEFSLASIPELSSIRNVVYQDECFTLRKAVSLILIHNYQKLLTLETIFKLSHLF
jgi:hypothetical protein